jgi:hypothetical protein
MQMDTKPRSLPRWAVLGATVFGLAAGSYGIAAAASGSGSSSSSGVFATTTTTTPSTAAAPQGWGAQRPDETLLTGDALAKVTAVAKDALPGATIVRVETDADGNARYEAHVIESDGTLATVYVDESFALVSVQAGGPGGPGGPHGSGRPGAGYGAPSSSSSGTGAIA